jgi:hypothetical protein
MTVTVTKVSPLGTQIDSQTPVVLDLDADRDLASRYVFAQSGHLKILIHDGQEYQPGWGTGSTVQEIVPNRSYRYSIIPNAIGWITSPDIIFQAVEQPETMDVAHEGSIDFSTDVNSYFSTNQNVGNFDGDDDFSVSFWVKRTSLFTHKLVSKRINTPNAFTGWNVGQEVLNGYFDFDIEANFGAGIKLLNRCSVSYDEDGWHHYVVTYDGSGVASGVKWVKDGAEVSGVVVVDNLLGASVLNSNPLTIGGWPTTFAQSFRGRVSSVAIYDKQLSIPEAQELYSPSEWLNLEDLDTAPNLVHWWGILDNQDVWPIGIDKRFGGHGVVAGGAVESSDHPWV